MNGVYTSGQKCFSYKELKSIRASDNNEPLVDLAVAVPTLAIGPYPAKMIPYTGERFYARESIANLLAAAQQNLSEKAPGHTLQICYAYRHPEVQKMKFERFMETARVNHPHYSEDDLYEYAHHYISIPDVGGHPAGAAIDLTILKGNTPLDMGSEIGDLSVLEKVPTYSTEVTEEQRANRLLLREVMTAAGFAPYDFEWWHFSYGDREWACYFQKPGSIYDTVSFQLKP